MYKVFINDNEVQFIAKNAIPAPLSTSLLPEYTSAEIIQQVLKSGNGQHVFTIADDNPAERFEKFLGSFKIIEAAGGIVRHHVPEGPVLMIFRRGKWDLPKGKIDAGESRKQAALREVEEECGIGKLTITADAGILHHLYELKGNWVVKKTWWYHMLCRDNNTLHPEAGEDITEARWVDEKDIARLLPDTFVSIAALLQDEIRQPNGRP